MAQAKARASGDAQRQAPPRPRCSRRSRALALSLAVGLAAPFASAPCARADDGTGLWYFTQTGVAAAHEAGIDGRGVTIAEIDTPYNPEVPWLAGADIVHREAALCLGDGGAPLPAVSADYDEAYHATDMIALIAGNGSGAATGQAPYGVAPGARVNSYAVLVTTGWTVETYGDKCSHDALATDVVVARAINAALDDGADIISMPVAFPVPQAEGESARGPYGQAILRALRAGVPIVTSRTNENEGDGLIDAFATKNPDGTPADPSDWKTALTLTRSEYFPGLLTLNALGPDGAVQAESDETNPGVDLAAPGVGVTNENGEFGRFGTELSGGTSSAVAITAGYLALAMQKWPQATGNQILQALVATASGAGERGGAVGWGSPNLPALLATDPGQYPDVNPILELDAEREYTGARTWGWHESEPFATDFANPAVAASYGRLLIDQKLAAGEPIPACLTRFLYEPLRAMAQAIPKALAAPGQSQGRKQGR